MNSPTTKKALQVSATLSICMIAFLSLGADRCREKSADTEQAAQTEKIMEEMNSAVGMPAIINFNEKRIAKEIFELRDDAKLMTFTYIVDMNGQQHLLCKSMGYGLPYSVQYTNPMRVAWPGSGGYLAMPQPDPNGLFMPDGLSATWVLCIEPESGEAKPLYVEPQIIVSPFALHGTE